MYLLTEKYIYTREHEKFEDTLICFIESLGNIGLYLDSGDVEEYLKNLPMPLEGDFVKTEFLLYNENGSVARQKTIMKIENVDGVFVLNRRIHFAKASEYKIKYIKVWKLSNPVFED